MWWGLCGCALGEGALSFSVGQLGVMEHYWALCIKDGV